ncbi:MAG: PD-(D/E)XK nuclease family protein [Nitrospinaceae bacterium]
MTDSLTLTVKDRLARWLLFRHDRQQEQSGLKIWERPAIYFMEDWLMQAWLQSWPEQYVLTELQSKHLWQKIIRSNPGTSHSSLLHVQGAASHASEAYQLIRKYRLPDDPSQFTNYTEETRSFRRWMTRYQKQLKEWGALDPSELLDVVSLRMEQGHIPLPGKIVFHGFDEISPQMQDWLNLLQSKNIPVEFEPFKPITVSPNHLQKLITEKKATVQKYEDANEEVIQCARWIRSIYKDGETIGIVVPKLEDYRSALEREFKAELAPASVYPWQESHLPFNISLGIPLSHEPMVHLALLLLSQNSKRIPLLTFSTLITSPFIKNPPDEIQTRRELDWKMRELNITHVFLPKALNPETKKHCPALSAFIDEWMKNWMDDKSLRLPSVWAGEITTFLEKIEWPAGSKTLSSHQYQALESWNKCLASLSSLDRILQKIYRNQAVSHLTHIIGEMRFQPKTRDESIQVVDLSESAGMEFNHLWIMGCDAETLPPIPNPNPFLPFLSHQKQFNLPHSTAERELAYTEQALFRLAQACRHLVFSYPLWKKETELMPSPLIPSGTFDKNTIHIAESNKLQDHSEFSISMEKAEDFSPIPVTAKEKEFIRGGTGIIKRQAACPFQAFAVHRLSSQQENFSELDMDDLARGSLIHKILEKFWERVQNSERLDELHESGELSQQIHQSILEGIKVSTIDVYGQSAFFEIEKERLSALLHEWMERERERGFFKISQLEKKQSLDLNGMTLNLTVDRIDESGDGKTTIIDYKTGADQNLKKWFGDRIEEPQLPLYSLIVTADAIAFATVRKSKPRYLGLSRENILIPGLESNISKKCPEVEQWDDLKQYWKLHLHHTAQEFLNGVSRVDPISEKETCNFCDQKTLCRKTELLNQFDGEDE